MILPDRDSADNLRGFLTLGILLMHASLIWWGDWIICYNKDSLNIFQAVYTYIGIPSFFFLSGYVNIISYRKRGFRSYLRRRIVRIGLPFLVGSAVFVPMMAYIDVSFNNTTALWPLFLQKINPVHVKFTFYHLWFLYDLLLFALIMQLVNRATRSLATISQHLGGFFFFAYIGMNIFLYVAALAFQVKVMPLALIPVASVCRHLPMFIFGALYACVDITKLLPATLKSKSLLLWFCAGVCISLSLRLWAPDTIIIKVLIHAMHIPISYMGIFCMLLLSNTVKLRIEPLSFIWQNPYRIYIFHQPLLIVLGTLMPGSVNSYVGCAVTTIICLAILKMVSPLFDSGRLATAVFP
jgi:hypothetical protein